jgi:predicted PurR-regulated permease PerM
MATDPVTGAPDAAEPPADPSADRPAVVTLRFTTRSLVGSVALLGVTLALIRVFDRAARPLSWVLVACIAAAVLSPFINRLGRHIPRPLAIIVVMLATLGVVAAIGYSGFDDLERQAHRLERALPSAARELERSSEFGDFARAFELEDRTERFVEELPGRLEGGSEVEALQAAATRGAAFLVTGILTLFMVVYGPRFLRAGLDQIADDEHRRHVERVVSDAYGRSWRYLMLTTLKAFVAGAFTTAVCSLADVQAPVLLGLWVGVWSFVPAVGIVVGSFPVVMLAALTSIDTAAVLLVVFVAYQLFDVLVAQPQITRRSLRVGSALTLVAGVLGFTLYGIGGLVVSVLLLMFAVGVLDTLAPDDDDELHEAVRDLVGGPTDDPVDGAAAGTLPAL